MKRDRPRTALLKDWVRKKIHQRGYELLVDPFGTRLVRTMNWLDADTVIDGGANTGQFGQLLRMSGFSGDIYSVEPLSAPFAQLALASQADSRWHAERGALSDTIGDVTINIAGNSVSSSILPMLRAHSDAAPESKYVGVESAPTTTVDSLVARHNLDPGRTLLKLDVQGYEAVALAGASECIKSFAAVQLELSFVPLYEGSWLADQTIDFMKTFGYDLWMLDPAAMYDPESGRLMQCDGVFVRS